MGSQESLGSSAYVGHLADHARRLQREARDALARGDYRRASALVGDAELLAEDVHGLVEDIEHRQTDRLLGLAAQHLEATAAAEARRRRWRVAIPSRSVRLALGTGIAMSLALVDC
ncbi:MAG: hypothetical protein ACKO1N_03435 [Erythrobacter sp.]